MSDPKLKEAMAEIKAVLTKHDIAATVTLVSPIYSEYLYWLSPSWSCVTLNGSTGEVRIRAKRKDFKTKKEHIRVCNLSAHMVVALKDQAGRNFLNIGQIEEQMKTVWDIERDPTVEHEPHREN